MDFPSFGFAGANLFPVLSWVQLMIRVFYYFLKGWISGHCLNLVFYEIYCFLSMMIESFAVNSIVVGALTCDLLQIAIHLSRSC